MASQQGRYAGSQGTESSLDPWCATNIVSSRWSKSDTSTKPASRLSPTRPAPQSQSLFRNYGSNIPIFLPYIKALYLEDLLRIWVRIGATPSRGPLLDFQGSRGRSGHRRNCHAFCAPNPISLLEVSRELECLYKKENSSRISWRRLQVILGYSNEHSYEGPNSMRFCCRVSE